LNSKQKNCKEMLLSSIEKDDKYLTFYTDKQLFGVPIAHVVQIVGMQKITVIPEAPYYSKGIINLRGAIIPVIDMRLRLSKLKAEYNERTCIIVTNINDFHMGIIVDSVDEVADIKYDVISQLPQHLENGNDYITGVAKLPQKLVLLMDLNKIFGNEDFKMITNITELKEQK